MTRGEVCLAFFLLFELDFRAITPGFKAKPNAHSLCAQESSLHTYHTENGYRITNITIYNIFSE
jgi:hypothetical protein